MVDLPEEFSPPMHVYAFMKFLVVRDVVTTLHDEARDNQGSFKPRHSGNPTVRSYSLNRSCLTENIQNLE